MEKQKSKIQELLKKMSSSSFKPLKQSPPPATIPFWLASRKKTTPSSPHRSTRQRANHCPTPKLPTSPYAVNQHHDLPPYEKSTIISYISTPHDTSITKPKLRKIKSLRSLSCKPKDLYQSTED
jgi:hypothetical protein